MVFYNKGVDNMLICGYKQTGCYQALKEQANNKYPNKKILSTHTQYIHDVLDIEDEATGKVYRGYSLIFPILCMEVED